MKLQQIKNLGIITILTTLVVCGWFILVPDIGKSDTHDLKFSANPSELEKRTKKTSNGLNQQLQIYQNVSTKPRQLLFSLGADDDDQEKNERYESALDALDKDNPKIASSLREEFEEYKINLSNDEALTIEKTHNTPGTDWLVIDSANGESYSLLNLNRQLFIYRYMQEFPNFPKQLYSQIPHDIDKKFSDALLKDAFTETKVITRTYVLFQDSEMTKAITKTKVMTKTHVLVDNYKFAQVKRLHDIYSWQIFLAINWPVDNSGNPTSSITDSTGIPQWATWIDSSDVFKKDGSEPDGSTINMNRLSETRQASNVSGDPLGDQLWDQNGNLVYYQILMNWNEFNYIKKNQLYNWDGQIKYNTPTTFPWGNIQNDQLGSIELKLAWKILDEDKGDIRDRFYFKDALVLDNGKWVTKTVGLVGMHITHKTDSSKKGWIWSTFEHVDNIQANDLEMVQVKNEWWPLKPSFNNPVCETCPVNVPPKPDEYGIKRTQVMRATPIPEATEELNTEVQKLLKEIDSVWQYYELIGTQWSTLADQVPTTSGVPDMITNEAGGMPTPTYLVNTVLETYLQVGNQPAKDLSKWSDSDSTIVFGTSSCIGCHSSASKIAYIDDKGKKVSGEFGSADFSWLLFTKAQPAGNLNNLP